mmetsp:Transcript_13940/g.56519  ORF Transcript_13940/g.56519 Transcript_13940/m.56519 type:complete len:215 (-) Transcript_13940:1013-1657(-)
MKVPSEIQAKSVGEVVISWNTELLERTDIFKGRVNGLALWDRHILNCRLNLLKLQVCPTLTYERLGPLGLRCSLQVELGKASSSQDRLERQLDILQTQQIEIMESITALESEVQRLKRMTSASSYATNGELFNAQELVFSLAEAASARLGRLGDIIACTIVGAKGNEQGVADAIWSSHEKNTPPYHVTMKANLEALCSIEEKLLRQNASLPSTK